MAESTLKLLAEGTFGIVMTPPPGLEVAPLPAAPGDEIVLDRAAGVGYFFKFFPRCWVDLRPESAAALDCDIERHVRALFDEMFTFDGSAAAKPAKKSLPAVLSIERHEIAGAPALTVLHRLGMQPTTESFMGHTLIPVEAGLFEARWSARDQMTGVRAAVLLNEHFARNPPASKEDAIASLPPPAFYDDPQHDARFPTTALSRVRAAKDWHRAAKIEITRPASAWPVARIRHKVPSCTLEPPPRFRFVTATDGVAMYRRVTFCGTDGVELLFVRQLAVTLRLLAASRLEKLVHEQMTALLDGPNATVEIVAREDVPPAIIVAGEVDSTTPKAARVREVRRYWVHPDGHVWFIGLRSSVAIPFAELVEQVRTVARSWRPG